METPNFELRIQAPEKSAVPKAVDAIEFAVREVAVEGATAFPPEQVNALPVLPRDLLRDEPNVDGSTRQVLSKELETIAADYGVDAPDNIRLLVMNRIDHGGKG